MKPSLFKILFTFLPLTLALNTSGQNPISKLKDINSISSTDGSWPGQMTMVGTTLYFSAWDGVRGNELWKSVSPYDGVSTSIVKDIRTGTNGSNPSAFINMGGILFFSADDGRNGNELWRSDGTAAGTYMVKDINPGSNSSNISRLFNINNTLYFAADDGVNGTELWKSNGTTAGTSLVLDIESAAPGTPPVPQSSWPDNFTFVNNTIYFTATNSTFGSELWTTDGTPSGTVLVKDIYPGIMGSSPSNLTALGTTLIFSAADDTNGVELWKSTSASAAGTSMAANINVTAALAGSYPSSITTFGSFVYFSANDGTVNGTELYKSDGTTTTLLSNINTAVWGSSYPSYFTPLGAYLYFYADDGTNGAELWRTNGTITSPFANINADIGGSSWPSVLTTSGTYLFFTAYTVTNGTELYRTDGTAPVLLDINSGAGSPDIWSMTPYPTLNTVFFSANDGSGSELWKSNGGAVGVGTTMVKNILTGSNGSFPGNYTYVGSTMFFVADDGTGHELWKSNGTTGGTVKVMDINSTATGIGMASLLAVGTTLYFTADDGTNGAELWKSIPPYDNTSTSMVVPAPGIHATAGNGSNPSNLVAIGSTLFFSADNGTGNELWKSDGTSGGTVLVKDIWASGSWGSNPSYLTVVGTTLYFAADDGVNGSALWKCVSPYLAANTTLVKDPNTSTSSWPSPYYLTAGGTNLYFIADDGTNGYELWKSDGTNGGTIMLKNINTVANLWAPNTNNGSWPYNLTYLNNALYFNADDGTNGGELWRSDGTALGTTFLKNINNTVSPWLSPGTNNGSYPSNFTLLGTNIFFSADDGVNGNELWITDGTAAGTQLFKNINAGANSGYPYNFLINSSKLFFVADDGTGYNVWASDGRTCATLPVTPYTAALVANPYNLANGGTKIFFAMAEQNTGVELFILDVAQVTLPVNTAINTQPLASQSAYLASSVSFSVAAVGGSLTYQWKKNGVGITGANAATYTLPSVVAGDQAAYTVDVIGTCGTVTSNAANLTVFAASPAGQATNLTFSNSTITSYTLNWAASPGPVTGYVVVMRTGASPTGVPVDGVTYTANTALGDGTIKYIGASSTFDITGLTSNTTYFFDVYAYNGSGTSINYLTTAPLEGSASTLTAEPTALPTALTFSGFTTTSMLVSFTPAAPAPTGYIVLRKLGGVPTTLPVDGNVPVVGNTYGDATVVAMGSTTTNIPSNTLTPCSLYGYAVYPYNGTGSSTNYLTTGTGNTGTALTLCDAPVLAAPVTSEISNVSFIARWTPPTGTFSSYEIEVSVDNFATLLTGFNPLVLNDPALTSSSISGLQPSTAYRYRIRAVNASGSSANSASQLVTTLNAPPVSIGTMTVTASSTISVSISGGVQPYTSVTLFYKGITSEAVAYSTKAMTGTGGNYNVDVSSEMATDELGLVFYIVVNNNSVLTNNSSSPGYIYRSYPTGANLPFTRFGTKQINYQVFSIPLDLGTTNNISDIFDEMGAYDKSKWRLFHWDASNQKYIEYQAGLTKIDRGKGYWFISAAQATVNTGPGDAPQGTTYSLQLQKGWNQVGNPYPFPIKWSDVLTHNGSPASVGPMNLYNGPTGYAVTDLVNDYQGGFVFADPAITLNIPAIIKNGFGARTQYSNPWEIADRSLNGTRWLVPLSLKIGENVNTLGAFGMHPEATTGKDGFDAITLPRFIEYAEGNFYHNDYFAPRFSKDIVPTQDVYTWEMAVETNQEGSLAELRWDPIALGNNAMTLYLYDPEQGIKVNMKETNAYRFVSKSKYPLQFYFSREGGAVLPDRIVIGSPYPNPFLASTSNVTIPFTLDSSLPEYDTRVSVIDMLGREVNVVSHEKFAPGFHEVAWNGVDSKGNAQSAGVYLVKFQIQGSGDRFARIVLQR